VPDETITVTLPASDWPTILAGLYELPMKHSAPVANRLQMALAEVQKPAEPQEKPEIPHIVRGKANG